MTTITTPRRNRKRSLLFGALGAGAGSLILAPSAGAQTLPTIDDFVPDELSDIAGDLTGGQTPDLPTAPLENVAQAIEGAVPSNLLRTNTAGADSVTENPTTDYVADQFNQVNTVAADYVAQPPQAGAPQPMSEEVVTHAVESFNAAAADPVAHIQRISDDFLNAMDGRGDPNTIGQAFGAWQLPTAETFGQIQSDVNTLAGKIQSGEIVNDIQTAIDETIASPQYEAWRTNTESIFNVDGQLGGVDRAAAGISHLIDTFTVNPARGVLELSEAAGGPVNMLLNPVNAITRAATVVLGEDLVREFTDVVRDVPGALTDGLLKAAPALLGIPASAALGGLATGLPGLLGSTLLLTPLTVIAPLIGAAAGSAIAEAIWATVTFGTWFALYALAAGIGTAISIGLGVTAGLLGWVISGFNPFAIPFAVFFGTGIFFISWFWTGIIINPTIIAPIVIYLLGFLPVLALGALPGLGLGTLLGLGSFLLGVPLLTALSAIPGALLGLGIGVPASLAAFAGLLGSTLGDRLGGPLANALGDLKNAADRGWRESLFGQLVGVFMQNFGGTESGHALQDLTSRIQALFATMAFLDGRRLSEMLARGGLLGAVLGKLLSTALGTLAGAASVPLTFLPNLLGLAALLTALTLPLFLLAGALTLIPPLSIAFVVTFLGALVFSGLWSIPLQLLATGLSLFSLVTSNPLLWLFTFGIPAIIAFFLGTASAIVATLNTISVLTTIGVFAVLFGIPSFFLTIPLFAFPALALTLAYLASLPGLIPAALGASLLEAILIGSAVDGLTSLATIPAGALLGAIAALLTHLRAGAGSESDGTQWVDGRIVNRGGFGDILSGLPGLDGEGVTPAPKEPSRQALPNVGLPRLDSSPISDGYSLRDETALLGV